MSNEPELLIKVLKNYQDSLKACIEFREQKKQVLENMGFHWQEHIPKELLIYHQQAALDQKTYSQEFLEAYNHFEQYYFFQTLNLEKNLAIIQQWIAQINIQQECLSRLDLSPSILEKFSYYYLDLIHLLRYPSYTSFELNIDKNLYKGVYFIKSELSQNEQITSTFTAFRNSLEQFVHLAIDALKMDLKNYIHERESCILNYYLPLGSYYGGFSKKEKIQAAESFLSLLEDPNKGYTPFKLDALKQGELSKMIKHHQHLFSNKDLENKDSLMEACHKLNHAKEINSSSSFFQSGR